MTRYYGPDHRDSLNAQFQTIRNTDYVDPANYSTNISNVYVDARFVSLMTDATNAALSANTHVCNIQGISLSAINTITNFYDNSEAIAAAIYRDAQGYCEVLRNLTETVNRLSELLRSVKSDGSLITVNDLRIACEPLRTANKIAIATALAGLYNPDGTMNEENAQQFRDAMAEMGITDITDEELALLYKIFVYLTQELGMDPADVIGDMPYIYNSAEFNQMINNPYVAGNSEAFWQNMAGIASRVRCDLSALNYMILVDSLTDENGVFTSQDTLDYYRSVLEAMGIYNVTDEEISYYLEVVRAMRAQGFSDEEIYARTQYIYNAPGFDQFSVVDASNRNNLINGIINSANAHYVRQTAIDYALSVANDPSHGYNQAIRAGGIDYDCSSLVCMAYQSAGVPIEVWVTGDMLKNFPDYGFDTISPTPTQICNLQPGDVLVNGHHTEIYIGNGRTVSASIDENNDIMGGSHGDQTQENTLFDSGAGAYSGQHVYDHSYDYYLQNGLSEEYLSQYFDSEGNPKKGEIRVEIIDAGDGTIIDENWTVFRYNG